MHGPELYDPERTAIKTIAGLEEQGGPLGVQPAGGSVRACARECCSYPRNVPGRKSDVNDAVWISDLLAHGLIRASFVPPAPIKLPSVSRKKVTTAFDGGRLSSDAGVT